MQSQDPTLQKFGSYIESHLPNSLTAKVEERGGELVMVVPPQELLSVLAMLRDDPHCLFRQLIDVCGVDFPEREKRFEVVYNLLSMKYNLRLRVVVQVGEEMLVPSASAVFNSANWYEREVWDMYGVYFSNHPDLRRILTDYGFEGHPQRKDFPLTGYVEVRYDEEKKRVVYEPVKLDQEFRSFDFESPWEGAKYILPGDKKAS